MNETAPLAPPVRRLGITVFGRSCHEQRLFTGSCVTIGAEGGSESDGEFWTVSDPDMPQRQCTIQRQSDGRSVVVTSLDKSIQMMDGLRIFRGKQATAELPVVFWAGETIIRVFSVDGTGEIETAIEGTAGHDEGLRSLDATLASTAGQLLPETQQRTPGMETLVSWFDSLVALQNDTGSQQDWLRNAARSLFDPGGLDAGIVLLHEHGVWKVASSFIPNPSHTISWRPDLVEQASHTGQTLFHCSECERTRDLPVYSVVAPIVSPEGDSLGAIVGMRSRNPRNKRRGIRRIEAHYAQLVAQSVAASLVRSRKEAEIAETHQLLRHVFPPPIVEALQSNPGILAGTRRTVATMFADLRGFSEMASRLPSETTWQLIAAVMDKWTEIVIANQGIIVDYYGDGLEAFWNAPFDLEDFAASAIASALEIQDSLSGLNREWSGVAGSPLRAGIGIATGEAHVGNCGSRKRIKYGPHGASVNLARRVEGCTVATGQPILICERTAELASSSYLSRPMGRQIMKGFSDPMPLWTPIDESEVDPAGLLTATETLVLALENGNDTNARAALERYRERYPRDSALPYFESRLQARRESRWAAQSRPGSPRSSSNV